MNTRLYYRCVVTMTTGESFVAAQGYGEEGYREVSDVGSQYDWADHVVVEKQEWVPVWEVYAHGISSQAPSLSSHVDSPRMDDGVVNPLENPGN